MTNTKLTGKQRRRPRRDCRTSGRAVDRQSLRDDLGQRLREAREQKKIGLRELARRLGVSPSLISQIETGKTEPSINTLFAMVSELELSVNEIVFDSRQERRPTGQEAAAPQAQRRSGRPARAGGPVPPRRPDSPVQRSTSRTSISLESGVSWQRLTAQPDHNVDFLYLRYPPGSESTPARFPDAAQRHGVRLHPVGDASGLDRVRHVRDRTGRHDRIRLHAAAPLRDGRRRRQSKLCGSWSAAGTRSRSTTPSVAP